jgi:hypothetical protein
LKCEILKQDLLIKELEQELSHKKKGLNIDIMTAKNEAAMMLQSHGISSEGIGSTGDNIHNKDENAKSKGSIASSAANLFSKKKENLEDKARILELIQQLEDNNQQVLIHKLEIRSLKDQVIKLLEERHFNLMGGGQ